MDPARALAWPRLSQQGRFPFSKRVHVGDYETKAKNNTAQDLLRGQRTEKKASSQLNFSPSAERDFILQSKEKEEESEANAGEARALGKGEESHLLFTLFRFFLSGHSHR